MMRDRSGAIFMVLLIVAATPAKAVTHKALQDMSSEEQSRSLADEFTRKMKSLCGSPEASFVQQANNGTAFYILKCNGASYVVAIPLQDERKLSIKPCNGQKVIRCD